MPMRIELFEFQHDFLIGLRNSGEIDPELQKQIDTIKERLIQYYGYNEASVGPEDKKLFVEEEPQL